ncbi:DUF362 domain-containing protein [candidate division KSB1 bacterium]|nr:DUF362 domain-containing protein [candidate division KSB1 bacterium]
MKQNQLDRRNFMQNSLLALGAVGAGLLAKSSAVFGKSQTKANPDITIVHCKDPFKAAKKAIEIVGGIKRFVSPGQTVVLLPNIISNSPPEFAVNTHPEVIRAVAECCIGAGAKVRVLHRHDRAYAEALGITKTMKSLGAEMVHFPYSEKDVKRYRQIPTPMGRVLDSVYVCDVVYDADVVINIPVAKHHAGSEITMAMKNLMGVVKEPRSFHYKGLHESIADLSTVVRPDLIVMDASRILLTNGPSGPGQTKVVDEVIATTDPIACDTYGASLLKKFPRDVPFLVYGYKQNLGELNLEKLSIRRENA